MLSSQSFCTIRISRYAMSCGILWIDGNSELNSQVYCKKQMTYQMRRKKLRKSLYNEHSDQKIFYSTLGTRGAPTSTFYAVRDRLPPMSFIAFPCQFNFTAFVSFR